MQEKYLVYGAHGFQGGAVVRALLAQGKRVRVLARTPAASPFARDERIELVSGDFDDVASLRRASAGVDGVYLMMPLSFDHPRVTQWGKNAIDAAADSSAQLLVYNTSGLVPDVPVGLPSLDTKHALERYLHDSRIPSISLRGTLYLGNLGAPWSGPRIVHHGVIAYPVPKDLRICWLSWEEAAAYAVAALARPDLAARKRVLQLGGAEAIVATRLTSAIADTLKKPMRYVELAPSELEAGMTPVLGARASAELAEFYRWVSEPRERSPLDVDTAAARAELPVPQSSVEAWAKNFPWSMVAGVEQ